MNLMQSNQYNKTAQIIIFGDLHTEEVQMIIFRQE
jgi:hypothetical protein